MGSRTSVRGRNIKKFSVNSRLAMKRQPTAASSVNRALTVTYFTGIHNFVTTLNIRNKSLPPALVNTKMNFRVP
jgi:hypothetical protein